jgi:hypothetical protein
LSEERIDLPVAARFSLIPIITTPEKSKADHRVPAVRKLNPLGKKPHPMLCRPAGSRQDIAWPKHCLRHESQVRPP